MEWCYILPTMNNNYVYRMFESWFQINPSDKSLFIAGYGSSAFTNNFAPVDCGKRYWRIGSVNRVGCSPYIHFLTRVGTLHTQQASRSSKAASSIIQPHPPCRACLSNTHRGVFGTLTVHQSMNTQQHGLNWVRKKEHQHVFARPCIQITHPMNNMRGHWVGKDPCSRSLSRAQLEGHLQTFHARSPPPPRNREPS